MWYLIFGCIVYALLIFMYAEFKYYRYMVKEHQNRMLEILALEYDLFILRERYKSGMFITDDDVVSLWNGDVLDYNIDNDCIVTLYTMKRYSLKFLYKCTRPFKLSRQVKLHLKLQSLYRKYITKSKNKKAVK